MKTFAADMRGILLETLLSVQKTNEGIASLVLALRDWEPPDAPQAAPAVIQRPPKENMTVAEAAEYSGYSKPYLYQLVSRKEIPCHRPTGGRVFFRRAELDGFLCRGKQDAGYETPDKAAAILNGEAKTGGRRRRHAWKTEPAKESAAVEQGT
jgi:excisionase family DNA binding protein